MAENNVRVDSYETMRRFYKQILRQKEDKIDKCGFTINMLTKKMNMLYAENAYMAHEFNDELRHIELRNKRLQDVNTALMNRIVDINAKMAVKMGKIQIENNKKLMNIQTESERAKIQSLYKIKELSNKVKNLLNNNDRVCVDLKNNEHNDNVDVTDKYAILTRKYNDLVIQENLNKIKFEKMQDEHKELEMKYDDLKLKYDEMKQKHDYKTWDANMIVEWIVLMDISRYGKYKDVLLRNMSKERIDGTCLKDLDKNDLHRLGVEQFKDKRDLYEEIRQLVGKDKRDLHEEIRQQEGQNDTDFRM